MRGSRGGDNPIYKEDSYGSALRINNVVAAHLKRLGKEMDFSLRPKGVEIRRTRFILRQYNRLRNASPENQVKIVRSHGWSIPELAALLRRYTLRSMQSAYLGIRFESAHGDLEKLHREKETVNKRADCARTLAMRRRIKDRRT